MLSGGEGGRDRGTAIGMENGMGSGLSICESRTCWGIAAQAEACAVGHPAASIGWRAIGMAIEGAVDFPLGCKLCIARQRLDIAGGKTIEDD
mmetsp:Transcript_14352/g.37244  ORF Transcript_14352/g.37244 Transcript_14352/m.37244 type:complete len:92 (+) Transcript_14352:1303-1578(+)